MFFDSIDEIPTIAKRTNFAIFVVPKDTKFKLKNVFYLEPDKAKGSIGVDMVRDFTARSNSREKTDLFFIVKNAETMTVEAESAFLKNLEEPKPHHHFVLLTEKPSTLLPTVLSRAQIFFLKNNFSFEEISADEKIKQLAKRLISSDKFELIALAKEISGKKEESARKKALDMTSVAIEMLYKTFFLTNNPKFLKKLPNLLKLYENLSKNGHIKLHIVADML